MLLSPTKASVVILLLSAVLLHNRCAKADDDDDKKAEKEEEEKDPWEKSTDKYRHKLGDTGIGSHAEEPVKIDVTEVSESEVHSERSKVCKNCNKPNTLNILVARNPPPLPPTVTATATPAQNATKTEGGAEAQYFNKNDDVDSETKEQIADATDEKVKLRLKHLHHLKYKRHKRRHHRRRHHH